MTNLFILNLFLVQNVDDLFAWIYFQFQTLTNFFILNLFPVPNVGYCSGTLINTENEYRYVSSHSHISHLKNSNNENTLQEGDLIFLNIIFLNILFPHIFYFFIFLFLHIFISYIFHIFHILLQVSIVHLKRMELRCPAVEQKRTNIAALEGKWCIIIKTIHREHSWSK